MDVESIGNAHEHVEQRAIVDGFSDLCITPAHIAKALHLVVSNTVCVSSESTNKVQQEPFRRGDRSRLEIPLPQRLRRLLVLLALQLQEPRMGA